jgi:hypothetical protein
MYITYGQSAPEGAIKAWHFIRNDFKTGTGGHDVITDVVYQVDTPIYCCISGLHGSSDIIDALAYAPGSILCRTLHWGKIDQLEGKLASTYRQVIWMVDTKDLLRSFAVMITREVVVMHAPQLLTVIEPFLVGTISDRKWFSELNTNMFPTVVQNVMYILSLKISEHNLAMAILYEYKKNCLFLKKDLLNAYLENGVLNLPKIER